MNANGIWVVFFISLWVGSCWFFYSQGWLAGNTAANIKAAQHFQPLPW